MALQVEDIVDCLAIKYYNKNVDFLFMIDQSRGHGHVRDGALNANTMNVRFGGKQSRLRRTKIKDVGAYERILDAGDVQLMMFLDEDEGPFYLDPQDRICRKYDQKTDKVKIINKTKKQLMEELKQKGFIVRKHYSKDKINELADNHRISLTCSQKEIVEAWVDYPKGMLQVLWERGRIIVDELEKYSADGKMHKKNEFGKVKKKTRIQKVCATYLNVSMP